MKKPTQIQVVGIIILNVLVAIAIIVSKIVETEMFQFFCVGGAFGMLFATCFIMIGMEEK